VAKTTAREDMRAILRELRRIRRANERAIRESRWPRRHIYPLAEHDHVLKGTRCWCSPGVRLADDAETEIVVHQRMN